MFTFLSILVVGFFLGMRHATDPDHVIAVTTIVSHESGAKRAALIGALWGLGHTATIFAVGTAIIVFNIVIPTRLGLSMELSVGLMLILLGAWNIIAFLRSLPTVRHTEGEVHSHPHHHGEYIHTHRHLHEPEKHSHSPEETALAGLDRGSAAMGVYQFVRPLVVGVVHGLAGSAAVSLLILASIQNSRWAIAYLLLFGLGTIAGMMLITVSIASTFRLVTNRFQHFSQRLALASGLVSLLFGLFLAYRIAFVNGIFRMHPDWIPH
jgi:ABC-type nickel/cobalt efflux system permease component RcnA